MFHEHVHVHYSYSLMMVFPFYSFSRLIDGSDIGQDYNLNDTFYLLYGRRLSGTLTLIMIVLVLL